MLKRTTILLLAVILISLLSPMVMSSLADTTITILSHRTLLAWRSWVDGYWLFESTLSPNPIPIDYILTDNVLQTTVPSDIYGAPPNGPGGEPLDYTYDSKTNLWVTSECYVIDLRWYCGCFVPVYFRGYLSFSGEPSVETFEHGVLYDWTYILAPENGEMPGHGNIHGYWANAQWDSIVGAWATQFTILYYDKTETSYPSPIPLPSPLPEPLLSITASDDVTVEGNTIGGATGVVLGNAVASGGVSPLTITNDALSLFPLGDTTVTWTATDASGNSASGTQLVTVQDTTPPSITVAGSLSVVVGAPSSVLPSPTVTDIVDSSPTVANDAPANFPAGITVATWTATDHSGNVATSTTTVTAHYNFIGFLLPRSRSTFKAGSTISVVFLLTNYRGKCVSTAVAKIYVDGSDASASGGSNSLNFFRWTLSFYLFNLNTKGMSRGIHTISVALDDGTVHKVGFTLK